MEVSTRPARAENGHPIIEKLDASRISTLIPNQILIDCDGVLTDGRLNVTHDGKKLFKSFHSRDVRAIRELVFNGFEVSIISADDWEAGPIFADKVGAEFVYLRDKSKFECDRPFIGVFDDAWDVSLARRSFMLFAPCDADQSILGLPDVEILGPGGSGIIAQVVRRLITY